ncbi:MAG: hypothetical protein P4L50_25970 [Anaerolineaceae bacterium]|nr:hypothetical protein [Anaerolineaceae bacterium]
MRKKILTLHNFLLVFLLAGCSSTALPVNAQLSTATAAAAASTKAPVIPQDSTPTATANTHTSTIKAAAQPPQPQAVVCKIPAALTPAVTEGPFFKPNSPERTSLFEAGMAGTMLTLTGYVLTANCQPVAHALLDFWQANAQGQYDNSGYTLRGHQYTDANGYYHLETIVPGLYPGRTEHIHVKVQAPSSSILTTQLFFPGTSENQSDSIYDPKLLMTINNSAAGQHATYNFIINANKGFY